jgi:putative flippase GtrA
LHEFLSWMEQSALGHFMRESSLWTYPVVNLLHIIGIASLFGSVVILDLRLLGCWRRVPLAPLTNVAVPVATMGFLLAAPTGLGLLATKATEYLGNPFLLIKFPAIALGLINAFVLNLSPAWRARGHRDLSRSERRQLAVMGGVSLACWLTAISAGRLIAYW